MSFKSLYLTTFHFYTTAQFTPFKVFPIHDYQLTQNLSQQHNFYSIRPFDQIHLVDEWMNVCLAAWWLQYWGKVDFLSDGRRRTEATEDLAIGGLGNSSAEEEFWLPPIEGEDKSTNCVTLWQSDIEERLFKKCVFIWISFRPTRLCQTGRLGHFYRAIIYH